VAISPDGKHLFVASLNSNGIAIFNRDLMSGSLTQAPGLTGCISMTGPASGCTQGRALTKPNSVVVSPDGKDVYVASWSSSAVTLLKRTP
jgi:DNA-binding beta-propeller fold protein YncE